MMEPHGDDLHTKYVLITGGSMSGIGKGVIAASIGTILKSCGVNVTAMKINPYVNVDSGTFGLYNHGEIFILDDGGQVDLDMGNFERFLDIDLPSVNNITTGKIYEYVINKERNNEYTGETVQLIPHVTNAIQDWIEKAALVPVTSDNQIPEVCIIELGGVIGDIDIMPFVEAFRQFQFRVKKENFCCVHVTWIPQPSISGELKTKPTQLSVQELRKWGIAPDVIICRSVKEINYMVKQKISNFCHVAVDQIISIPDMPSLYHIPVAMKSSSLTDFLCDRLHLAVPSPRPRRLMTKWRELANRYDQLTQSICIALIGKYTKLDNSYTSLRRALLHAALACDCKLTITCIYAEDLEQDRREKDPMIFHKAWEKLCRADGIVVPGGSGPRGVEGKIAAIEWTRQFRKPFLGIGMGYHCTIIEYARNVLNWKDAHTTEINKDTAKNVVTEMPENPPSKKRGSTMKLGKRQSLFKHQKSTVQILYGNKEGIEERHCHLYDVNPKYVAELEKAGMKFIAQDASGQRMDILEVDHLPYFVGVQFHPEFLSRPLKPAPTILGLILAACGKLDEFTKRSFRLSPRYGSDVECSDEETFSISGFPEGDSNPSQSTFITTNPVDHDTPIFFSAHD